jgi:hypothetical protein
MNLKNTGFLLLISSIANLLQGQEVYIMVDQFGYRPHDTKVAVLANPVEGYNEADEYIPGDSLYLINENSGSIVFSSVPAPYNNGKVDVTSGDIGWWFDFSMIQDSGSYHIYDPKNEVSSYSFRIHPDVYQDVLKASIKMFYYQRLGISHIAKYAGEWTDNAAYQQDSVARYVMDRTNEDLFLDLRGGWMDAGDHNKYVTFVGTALHILLNTYTDHPDLFTDDLNIPESGNGIPDIIDEIKWEVDWIMRMQDTLDGGVYIKMGNLDGDLVDYEKIFPSEDKRNRYYGPKCTSSTIYAASIFAHMALVLEKFRAHFSDYIPELIKRSYLALEYYQNHPKQTNCDDQTIRAGDADRGEVHQRNHEGLTYLYLYMSTREDSLHSIAKTKALTLPIGDSPCAEALLSYATSMPYESDITMQLRGKKLKTRDNSVFYPGDHLYRASVPSSYYSWGGNSKRANAGSLAYDFIQYGIDSSNHLNYHERGINLLHYFHGVNPLNKVYLTNMYPYGADNCVSQIYHNWFTHNSRWDENPAPGYLPGGPNASYTGSLSPPKNQPLDKCYFDFNEHGSPKNAWEVTEPMCHYQAHYVRLVASYTKENCDPGPATGLRLVDDSITMYPEAFVNLFCEIFPGNICNRELIWISEDTSVVKVNSLGGVLAKEAGTTKIIVTHRSNPSLSDTATIIVKKCERTTFLLSPEIIPGTIHASYYNNSCADDPSYFDTTPGNSGECCRDDDVDIQFSSIGGSNVGWIATGEWLEYTVDIKNTGHYKLETQISSASTGGSFTLSYKNGENICTVNCPVTGGWQVWQTVENACYLEKGRKTIRIYIDEGGFNINRLLFKLETGVEDGKDLPNLSSGYYIVIVNDIMGRYLGSFTLNGEDFYQKARQFARNNHKNGIYVFKLINEQNIYFEKLYLLPE